MIELDDCQFDDMLAQRGVIDADVKSFIDYDDQLIVVRNRLQSDHKRELLLHEVLHACIADSGTLDDHEHFASLLAPRLIQLIDTLSESIDAVIHHDH